MNDAFPQHITGHILIVDDVPENVQLLSRTLSEKGHKVRGVLSGEMALRASNSLPDLILLDVMMPDMNGYDVCRQLKKSPHTCNIPVIFLSALDASAHKVRAFDVGGVDYITKPFQLKEVHARVSHQLKLQHLQKQLIAQAEALSEKNKHLQQEIHERKQIEEALRESEIEERQKKQELSQTLDQLQKAQSQLIHQEKMSGLGQLVAGVAHEINNPVTFIYGNLECAETYAQDLLKALQIYQKIESQLPKNLKAEIDDLGLDFIREDFPKLLESMNVGAERIREIVNSLRVFSRHSEGEIKPADIHEGLDSTLMILQSRLRPQSSYGAVTVEKNYGDLPKIECYSGQLNQVFMNILTNAIDALEPLRIKGETETFYSHRTPTIQIQTKSLPDNVIGIYISDNGPGVPKEVKTRLFDPFFTTKDIGKGTGLGLSISYKIVVERHGGDLRCISVSGQGAMFAIEIPVVQPKKSS
ncbi:response regulator receiver sensor signal transduction histidine kinase [[Leptolyngbya] sp. PCC 7376]|uniref:hybrid sensor histidine kinase/response regulator n=1 Tax=[Leptolyngbya] sp. PCC 7376 TaxID=111781 RepID=UPI00029EECB2|nr:response regulator [[Leptolyngbya] sp. PCC 7376]AFY39446.1 response regulator receiver sensor signal transduction histidine kinase [[Leptolyngbya] sp. PCC 7376]